MRIILIIISFIGLGLTLIPSGLVLTGAMTMDQNKFLMMLGTILWFGSVVFWMNKKK
jgi:hypothetical protein